MQPFFLTGALNCRPKGWFHNKLWSKLISESHHVFCSFFPLQSTPNGFIKRAWSYVTDLKRLWRNILVSHYWNQLLRNNFGLCIKSAVYVEKKKTLKEVFLRAFQSTHGQIYLDMVSCIWTTRGIRNLSSAAYPASKLDTSLSKNETNRARLECLSSIQNIFDYYFAHVCFGASLCGAGLLW